jgi:hypothetical protein
MENDMRPDYLYKLIVSGFILLFILACNSLIPLPDPTPVPPTPTATPVYISQQVTVASQSHEETNQTPPFTIKSQTPQLAGSDDPRVTAFNKRLDELVSKEVDTFRQGFLQNPVTPMTSGSFLEVTYTLLSQIDDLWSFKFDFNFYSDGAAHPGLYSMTMNHDLGQGRELALGDLFLPSSNYLEVISNYCITELSKQPFFDGAFTTGADPNPENYRNWNLTPDGLLITFDTYQVAPGAAGPQQVLVLWVELQGLIDPQGALAGFVQ